MRSLWSTLVFVFTTISFMYSSETYIDFENLSILDHQLKTNCCEEGSLNYEEDKDIPTGKSMVSLFPSPATIGKNVTVNNVEIGQKISIFKQSGKFIKSQVIDVDKQIYTADLQSGEYIIRADALYLKLLIE